MYTFWGTTHHLSSAALARAMREAGLQHFMPDPHHNPLAVYTSMHRPDIITVKDKSVSGYKIRTEWFLYPETDLPLTMMIETVHQCENRHRGVAKIWHKRRMSAMLIIQPIAADEKCYSLKHILEWLINVLGRNAYLARTSSNGRFIPGGWIT